MGHLLIGAWRRCLGWCYGDPLGTLQGLSPRRAAHPALVVGSEYGPGFALSLVRQKKPIAVASGQVHRGVSPGDVDLGRGCQARLPVGIVGRRQSQIAETVMTRFDHSVERGQVLAVFDGMLCSAQDHDRRVFIESFEPQALDLLDLLGIAPSRVILVVVVETKQGKNLIKGLDELRVRTRAFFLFSWPSWCR